MVRVWCSEWGEDVKKENNWNNELHVKIQNSTWMNFLKNNEKFYINNSFNF